MTEAFIAWSHSRLKTYRECPKAFYHANVPAKNHPDRLPFIQTKAMQDGNAIDEALTARIGKGTPLPPEFASYEGMCAAVLAAPGQKFTQFSVTLDQAFTPVGWFDKSAWVRAKYDFALVNGTYAYIVDWKNGQVWLDEEQLKLFAATAFILFPEVDVVDTSYVWLRHGVTSDKTYKRREAPDLWEAFLPDVERMQISYRTNHWPATPKYGKKACSRCDVNAAGKCPSALAPYEKKK